MEPCLSPASFVNPVQEPASPRPRTAYPGGRFLNQAPAPSLPRSAASCDWHRHPHIAGYQQRRMEVAGFGGEAGAAMAVAACSAEAGRGGLSCVPAAVRGCNPSGCWPKEAGLGPCGALEQQGSCGSLPTALPQPGSGGSAEMQCCAASPLVALVADGVCWPAAPAPAEPAWRARSLTPEEAGMAGGSDSPLTPTAAPSYAAVSPLSAPAPSAAAAAPAAAAAAAAASQRAASAAALWRRVHSFMHCVAGSPLVQSALLSVEMAGTHPAGADPELAPEAGLDWTLAQLLALHVKAGLEQATEHSVLASLWVLESLESVWRSPATVCLNDYLKHLAAFSPEAVVAITADWHNSFRALRAGVVDAQMDLLKRLDWCVRLDAARELRPCRELLFKLAPPASAAPPRASTTLHDRWAAHMRLLVQRVQHKAQVLRKHSRPAGRAQEEAQACHPAACKRQRI